MLGNRSRGSLETFALVVLVFADYSSFLEKFAG